jgi:hypothetical protein
MNATHAKTIIVDMADVRRVYAYRFPDGHWFDRDSMRFFKTRLPRHATATPDNGCYWFVTSEQNPSGIRRYSVRCMSPTGMNSIGDGFHRYATRAAAVSAMNAAIHAKA